jgi:replicative DNA helicase
MTPDYDESDGEIEAPHNTDSERIVLGSMLLNANAIDELTAISKPQDFYWPAHVALAEALVAMRADGHATDAVAVLDAFVRRGSVKAVGGGPYLHRLIESVPAGCMADHHADIVRRYAQQRFLKEVGTRLVQAGVDPNTDIDDVADLYHLAIKDLTDGLNATPETTVPTAGELLVPTLDAVENPPPNRHVPIGIHDLDAALGGGVSPGQLILVAARPAVGKSVLALGAARHAAIRCGVPTLLVNLEMSGDATMRRLIAAEAGVNLHHLTSSTCDERDWSLIARIAERVMAAPLYIDGVRGLTVAQLRQTVRKLSRTAGLGLVVVDYLQLMTAPRAENREQAVGALSRELKQMSQEFNVPIVALAQLNRESTKRTDKRPQSSDLRESGSLEANADTIILMHRDDKYDRDSPRAGECDLILDKQRDGAQATITVAFQGHYSRLVDMAAPYSVPSYAA